MPAKVRPSRSRRSAGRMIGGVLAAGFLLSPGIAGSEQDRRRDFARPAIVPFPAYNPHSPAKEELGRALFYDTRLSRAGDRACASCHDPRKEFGDGRPLPRDVNGRLVGRHAPVLWNLAWSTSYFWDGRAATLEDQVREPMRTELGLEIDELVRRLTADPAMTARFAEAFPARAQVTEETIAAALATFVRTLVSPRNRFDDWVDGDDAALSPAEQRGFELFVGKAGCSRCHAGWNFTDQRFHDTGLADDDRGRGGALGIPDLDHRFKTPTLRGVRWSQPFMHNGRIAKLRYVVEHYERNFLARPTLAPEVTGFELTDDERNDLVGFLRAIGDGPARPSGLPASPDEDHSSRPMSRSSE